jgi:ribosomal protein S18 acetylase RimI-like enzyme
LKQKDRHKLFEDYSIEIAEDAESFQKFFNKHVIKVFGVSGYKNYEEIFTRKEKENLNILSKNLGQPYRLRLYILKGNKKIGWFFGAQHNFETFYMTNTGIFKQYRNKGIYKKMLPKILAILKEKGFQKVYSRHSATNNNVIVPKLKEGFVISGFEISDVFGMLVHLTYYFNETRRKVIEYRVTGTTQDARIAGLLN